MYISSVSVTFEVLFSGLRYSSLFLPWIKSVFQYSNIKNPSWHISSSNNILTLGIWESYIWSKVTVKDKILIKKLKFTPQSTQPQNCGNSSLVFGEVVWYALSIIWQFMSLALSRACVGVSVCDEFSSSYTKHLLPEGNYLRYQRGILRILELLIFSPSQQRGQGKDKGNISGIKDSNTWHFAMMLANAGHCTKKFPSDSNWNGNTYHYFCYSEN